MRSLRYDGAWTLRPGKGRILKDPVEISLNERNVSVPCQCHKYASCHLHSDAMEMYCFLFSFNLCNFMTNFNLCCKESLSSSVGMDLIVEVGT